MKPAASIWTATLAGILSCVVLGMGPFGCESEDSEPFCSPGQGEVCECTTGSSGLRYCRDDGTAFKSCACLSDRVPDAPSVPESPSILKMILPPPPVILTTTPLSEPLPEELEGSYVIDGTSTAFAFASVRTITGDLTVEGRFIKHLSLAMLESVGGDFSIHAPKLKSLTLPLLESVAGHFSVVSIRLEDISFPSLESIGGTTDISWCTSLVSLSLPLLAYTGDLKIWDNDALSLVELPSLATAGNVSVVGNDVLPALDFPVLTHSTGSLLLLELGALQILGIENLEKVSGDVWLRNLGNNSVDGTIEVHAPVLEDIGSNLVIMGSDNLTACRLDALHTIDRTLRIQLNPSLTDISLPSLAWLGGDLNIQHNGIAACVVEALAEQIQEAGGIAGDIQTASNNNACTCTESEGELDVECP